MLLPNFKKEESYITQLIRNNADFTQILIYPELMIELRTNAELQQYFSLPQNMTKLVENLCQSEDQKIQILSGAVLTSNVGSIVDSFFSDEKLCKYLLQQLTFNNDKKCVSEMEVELQSYSPFINKSPYDLVDSICSSDSFSIVSVLISIETVALFSI